MSNERYSKFEVNKYCSVGEMETYAVADAEMGVMIIDSLFKLESLNETYIIFLHIS